MIFSELRFTVPDDRTKFRDRAETRSITNFTIAFLCLKQQTIFKIDFKRKVDDGIVPKYFFRSFLDEFQ